MPFSYPSRVTRAALLSLLAALICPTASVADDAKPSGDPAEVSILTDSDPRQVTVFKGPSCGCCQEWIDHINADGFSSVTRHPADLNLIKDKYGIAPDYQSCHTAVSEDGFIFEGHIPAKIIARFLAEKPADARGLAVPGMPMGSPGMERGDEFAPYDVLLLKKDGSTRVYTRVNLAKDQH